MALLIAGCSSPPPPAKRVSVKAAGPGSIELVPAAGQLPYCLVLARAESGVVRQLTPIDPNEAIPCPAGAPIGGTRYAIPKTDGKTRVFVVFSDRAIDGRPVAAQVRELGATATFSAMDLRAPGNVALETLEIEP